MKAPPRDHGLAELNRCEHDGKGRWVHARERPEPHVVPEQQDPPTRAVTARPTTGRHACTLTARGRRERADGSGLEQGGGRHSSMMPSLSRAGSRQIRDLEEVALQGREKVNTLAGLGEDVVPTVAYGVPANPVMYAAVVKVPSMLAAWNTTESPLLMTAVELAS